MSNIFFTSDNGTFFQTLGLTPNLAESQLGTLPTTYCIRFLIHAFLRVLWIFENFFPGLFWDFSDFSILIFSGNSGKPLQQFDTYYRFRPCSFRCSKNFHPFFPFSARKISFGILYYTASPLQLTCCAKNDVNQLSVIIIFIQSAAI